MGNDEEAGASSDPSTATPPPSPPAPELSMVLMAKSKVNTFDARHPSNIGFI